MSDDAQRDARRAAERRRRLAEVFGTTPEQTSDDTDPGEGSASGIGDTWWRDQVPPHHGG